MKKTIRILVELIIVAILAGACATGVVSPKKFSAPLNNLSDPVSVVDVNGYQHIVGVYNNRIYYVKTLLDQEVRTKGFDEHAGWIQKSPDIAVQEDGKVWFVWVEENTTTHELKACQFPLPAGSTSNISCAPISATPQTNGLIRAVALGNTAYAVWDVPAPQSALKYRQLGSSIEGFVVWFDWIAGEQGVIDFLDLDMDAYEMLHVVWVDHTSPTSYKTRYNSNAVTGDFYVMDRLVVLNSSSTQPVTSPHLSFHGFSLVENVIIGELDKTAETFYFWFYRFPMTGYIDGSSISFITKELDDWDVSDVDILGQAVSGNPLVALVGTEPGASSPQVYTWSYPFSGLTEALTTTETEKIGLQLHGTAPYPLIGWMEYVVTSSPPLFIPIESNTLYVYEIEDGIRAINSDVCQPDSQRKVSLSVNLNPDLEYYPVAGVWRQCGNAWFSNNAFQSFYPLIRR